VVYALVAADPCMCQTRRGIGVRAPDSISRLWRPRHGAAGPQASPHPPLVRQVLAYLLRGKPERSKLVCTTGGQRVDVKLERPVPYELDGGAPPVRMPMPP
jgi:hypothetical protein